MAGEILTQYIKSPYTYVLDDFRAVRGFESGWILSEVTRLRFQPPGSNLRIDHSDFMTA
jgi:hypothetical protein